jgi:prepilin-type processing-associated H-X9-DG protein
MSTNSPPPRLSRTALLSLLLGLSSMVLFVVTGVPALFLGLRGLRAINASEDRLTGRRLAVAGMVLGGLGCLATLVGVFALVVIHLAVRARRVECANNLRQLGLGASRYADNHDLMFPPGTLPNPALPPEQRLSWLVVLLPYLGETDAARQRYKVLNERIDRGKGWNAPANAAALNTPLAVCTCPAHPDVPPHPALTFYVGLAGVGPKAALLPTSSPRAGIFGYDRAVRRTDVRAGLSFTMLATETAQDNGPWLAGGPATVRELAPDEEHYVGPGRPFGGLHPDGLNVLWADASVRWLNNNVPAADFRALATLSGKPDRP